MPILNGNPVDALNSTDPGATNSEAKYADQRTAEELGAGLDSSQADATQLGEGQDANADPTSVQGTNPISMRRTSSARISAPTSRMRRTTVPSIGTPLDENADLPPIPKGITWEEVERYFKK